MSRELDNIDLKPAEHQLIKKLLETYLPDTQVWAFGSRVTFESRPSSDLDLVAFTTEYQQRAAAHLREAFEESNLPFEVDVLEWRRIPEHFKPNMQRTYFVMQKKPRPSPSANEWADVRLGDVSDIHLGGASAQDEAENGAYPLFDRSATVRKSDEYLFDCQAVIVPGYGRRFSPRYFSGKFNLCQDAYCITSKSENHVQTKFIYHCLRQHLDYWISSTVWAAAGRLKPDSFMDFPLKLPPLETQKTIVHFLNALEDKIQFNKKKRQIIEELSKSIFKSWFVDFDPVCTETKPPLHDLAPELRKLFPNELADSEIGKIPKGWQCQSLDEIVSFIKGAGRRRYLHLEDGERTPLITTAQLRKGHTDDDFHTSDAPADLVVRDGDFLFSWTGSVFAKYWAGGKGALGRSVFKVESKGCPLWFVAGWVEHFMPELQFLSEIKSTVIRHVDKRDLQRAVCAVPDLPILEKLGEIFQPLADRQIVLQQESRALRKLRDAVLPKLISGELDVSDAEQILGRSGIE